MKLFNGRGILSLAVTALFALAALAGCGGGDSTASEPQPQAQFVKQAEAICTQSHKKVQGEYRAFEEAAPGRGTPAGKQLEEFAETVVVPSLETQLDQLDELGPPQGAEAKANAYFETLEGVIEEGESNPSALVGSTPWQRLGKAAKAVGLKECGDAI
jgi:hypothetical protein